MDSLYDPPPEVIAAVEMGAAWLDKNRSEWLKRINIRSLRMSTCSSCILGQLDGSFNQRYLELSQVHGVEAARRWLCDHGFDIPTSVTDTDRWNRLREAWVRLIERRRSTS